MEEGKKIETPVLDWFERYKRLIDLGYRSIMVADDYIHSRYGEEDWLEYVAQTRPKWTEPVARRIVEKHDLKPTLEDALKLWAIYSQEVWGYGDSKFVDTRMETETQGRLTAKGGCRIWALTPEEERGKIPCHRACTHEMQGVANALVPTWKVHTPKACPLGDASCEFVLTAKKIS